MKTPGVIKAVVWCAVIGTIVYLKLEWDNGAEARRARAESSTPYLGNSITGAFMHGLNEGSNGGDRVSLSPDLSPPLDVLSYGCEVVRAYTYVRGEVKNVSTRKLANVIAIATLTNKNGEFIKSDTAVIEYRPLMPGQTSPFEVMTENHPEFSKCHIAFRLSSGELLEYKKKGK